MKYPQLTVYNYKIAYYAIRIFGLYWLIAQYYRFLQLKSRPKELFEPVFWLEKIIFPELPDTGVFVGMLVACGIALMASLLKPSYVLNILIFLLITLINLPISANFGVRHTHHLIILGFFLSIFLLPKDLEEKDYKLVQYFYLGLLVTYSMAGMSKFLGTAKNLIKNTDKLLWINKGAAKMNTYDNYYMADMEVPGWIKDLYAYDNLWVVLTVVGISLQLLCFLGAFNRKLLTFFMLFIVIFHLYTYEFVVADALDLIPFVIAALFPYHIFKRDRRSAY
ncbi:hypothetical protein [Chryseobacterium pennipullorum]|uniref:HTTM domain-containing protein n=1 Tax=Chryseobacterium pennipullorum TaxID=2258963 RepID=A0A3D9AZE9_9FLAO|nr:hypothetical protein [Chryseobacterium pennipullorum]REC46734.1 hypothetical protein DRF67_12980 [Chryseobacterium pennipullorum]